MTIRTFDAGGDKPVAGFTPTDEANPFLGIRGLRLCLQRPDIFMVQLRALVRAAVRGNLKVMFPMVTAPDELEQARVLVAEAARGLRAEEVAAVVESAIRVGAKAVWMQEGIVDEAAAGRAREAGLMVVMDRCMLKEHRKSGLSSNPPGI